MVTLGRRAYVMGGSGPGPMDSSESLGTVLDQLLPEEALDIPGELVGPHKPLSSADALSEWQWRAEPALPYPARCALPPAASPAPHLPPLPHRESALAFASGTVSSGSRSRLAECKAEPPWPSVAGYAQGCTAPRGSPRKAAARLSQLLRASLGLRPRTADAPLLL